MVAVEGAGEAVLHQPGAAIRAVEAVTAGATERERRVSPPVEEEQRLLAGVQGLGESHAQGRCQPGAARRRRLTQVDGLDRRQLCAAVPVRQALASVAAILDVDHRLQRRRGRCQHDRAALEAGAHHRHVAGVVDDAVLLLEGGVVLLVDHDETETAEGQPERRASTDHHRRPALGNGAPGLAPLARAKLGVPDRRVGAEARAKAREPLGAERDLGQHHQDLIASIERGRDGLKIDLGLAGAGHAVKDCDRERLGGDPLPQRLGGGSLRLR